MILLRSLEGSAPEYQTQASSAADLKSREDLTIAAGAKAKVATGVWIESVDWDSVPSNCIPELQIRARSGLAYKLGITLTNAVGTIDADYREEINVLLWNTGNENFTIKRGDRIAQLVLQLSVRIPNLKIKGERAGGFGSTGI